MSGADFAARGLSLRAINAAARRPLVLMAAGASAPIYGGSGAPYVAAHEVTLPGDTIVGGSALRLRVQIAKYDPMNAGYQWRARIVQGSNAVILAQNAVGASMRTMEVESVIRIAHDRKSAFTFNVNALNAPSLNAEAAIASTGVRSTASANMGARQPGTQISFVTNSAPPTVEAVLIDFSRPLTLAIEVQAINGDTVEVLGATLEMLAAGAHPANYSGTRATAVWGDSLTEGTGATAVSGVPMDWVAQLRRQRAGWPITAKGLGGQKSAAIVERMLADPVAGKSWNAVIWAGANDFDDHIGDGPNWFAAIRPQIDRALAVRRNPRTIICNFHPRANWSPGDANYQAMQHVNAQLAAAYGHRLCDVFAALATDGGKVPAASMADSIHLANPGHSTVMQAVHAKMTDLGW